MGNFKQHETLRSQAMAYVNDGILDIFAGWSILFAGLAIFADQVWMAGILVAIFLPSAGALKEKVTLPRLSERDIIPGAAARTGKLLMTALILGVVFLLLGGLVFVLFDRGDLPAATEEAILLTAGGIIAALILGGFTLIGAVYRASRWFGYPFLGIVLGLLAWWLDVGFAWVLVAFGGVMVLVGTACLVRFMRSHPVLSDGDRHAW